MVAVIVIAAAPKLIAAIPAVSLKDATREVAHVNLEGAARQTAVQYKPQGLEDVVRKNAVQRIAVQRAAVQQAVVQRAVVQRAAVQRIVMNAALHQKNLAVH